LYSSKCDNFFHALDSIIYWWNVKHVLSSSNVPAKKFIMRQQTSLTGASRKQRIANARKISNFAAEIPAKNRLLILQKKKRKKKKQITNHMLISSIGDVMLFCQTIAIRQRQRCLKQCSPTPHSALCT
jgi:hypothetical protein